MASPVNTMCTYDGFGVGCAECPEELVWNGNHCDTCEVAQAFQYIACAIIVVGLAIMVVKLSFPVQKIGTYCQKTVNIKIQASVVTCTHSHLLSIFCLGFIFTCLRGPSRQ